MDLIPMVNEANAISEELDRKVNECALFAFILFDSVAFFL